MSSDPLRGLAIEAGEAESLIDEIGADLSRHPVAARAEPPEHPRPEGSSPLQRARRLFRMNAQEYDAMILAIAVELDHRFARIVAFLNDHVTRTRPTVGLVLALVGGETNAVAFCGRPAVRLGLLRAEGDGPASSLTLRVSPRLLERMAGGEPDPHSFGGMTIHSSTRPTLGDLLVEPEPRAILERWSRQLARHEIPPPLLLTGPSGSGRATAARAASLAANRGAVEIDWTPDGRALLEPAGFEAFWREATLLIRVDRSARETDFKPLWNALAEWDVPIALTAPDALTEAISASASREPLAVAFGPPNVARREQLWRRLLADHPRVTISEGDVDQLAARFEFVPGLMARALRRASADESRPIDIGALSAACRGVGNARMGALAQRLDQPFTRADLVLPEELIDELNLATAWIRNQRTVFEEWGFRRRLALGRGLTALFAGPPGTGKTMTAQVLARDLGLDLFRVDLSQVMSKYIGETEKHLSNLFADARASGGILFFDEADALFGKRSEVKDAHDRYANLEIGYLLQKLEEHPGTTILATNRKGDLDEAFLRRFHFMLDFPMPQFEERRRIWKGMFPGESVRDPDLGLDTLAREYEISGGEIRNSILSAAFMAAEDGAPIGTRHIKRGLRRELMKSGRVLDSRQRRTLETT